MRAIVKHIGLLCVCVGMAVSALAENISESPLVVYTPTSNTQELLNRYSQPHEKANEYWQLTEEEWSQYENLKEKSPWAQWENNASPLAVLSYYSSSLDDKRRYARIEAELDTWRQHSVVEFQTLYDKERSIVHKRYVEYQEAARPTLASVALTDRLKLFVQANDGQCDAHCRAAVSRVLGTQAHLDIFVIGTSSDEVIFKWAEAAAIPIERVKTKEVTLNHANGLLKFAAEEAGVVLPRLPCLFRKGANGKSQFVMI